MDTEGVRQLAIIFLMLGTMILAGFAAFFVQAYMTAHVFYIILFCAAWIMLALGGIILYINRD